MNTLEIERFIRADSVSRRIFQGVFSADTLPDVPSLLVCNTDKSTKPGLHWIAIYVDNDGRGEYFDSFGRAPNEHFKHYMDKHCSKWTFNKRQLQSIVSSFCGYYCCMYCMLRSRRVDMTRVVGMFTNDTGFNDTIAHGFVCNKSY
jgi:hypothetical protein